MKGYVKVDNGMGGIYWRGGYTYNGTTCNREEAGVWDRNDDYIQHVLALSGVEFIPVADEIKVTQEREVSPFQAIYDANFNESLDRKNTPIWSGVLQYFPDAIAAVARLSKKGNDKHNPGEPLHWNRGKSNDHGDCIVRHQMEPEVIDVETGEFHAVAVAWRALAQLQLLEEKRLGKVPNT